VIVVLSRAQMRAFDEHAIRTSHVPGLTLMENAGRGAAEEVLRRLPQGRSGRVVVVCGAGNNGGDGFVVARHLVSNGAKVEVFVTVPPTKVIGDARTNLEAFLGIGGAIAEVVEDLAPLRASLAQADAIVDALFGTGLDRPVTGVAAAVILAMNDARGMRIAIDVPSGLNADTGAAMGTAVHADVTVTFGHYKLGLLTPHGARLAGRIELVGLGVPSSLVPPLDHTALLIEPSDVARTVTARTVDAYKNTAGHVVVFAGSPGKVGAALMASRAAFRAGAGLVTIATWADVANTLDARVEEAMTARIARDDITGSIDEILENKRAVVIGPGFGREDSARLAVEHVLKTWEGPTVVDADALALFEQTPEVFAASKGAPVLTPHPGELARLLGTTARDVEADRFAALAALVDRARCVVVLKGAHTLIGAPEERSVINASGNPAMATAGAGDVLAGIIGALACTADPFEAACAGVYLHGAAADTWCRLHGGADRGLLAGDIADALPLAFAGVGGEPRALACLTHP
jgi:hydroxyethylthiazole kinase-like uncharacterized protein yjeF